MLPVLRKEVDQRALHLKHTFLPACHRKVSTGMLAIGFSPCLSKKRPSQEPNGQPKKSSTLAALQAWLVGRQSITQAE